MTVWNEDFNAGYETGYKDGESSGYADAVAKYEDEIEYLKEQFAAAQSEAEYWKAQTEMCWEKEAGEDY